MGKFAVTNKTRRPAPVLPFLKVAKAVLPSFEISLAFVGESEARKINAATRGKSYVPNVLSYAAGPASGEIIICLPEAKRQAPSYGMLLPTFILFLFIHGLLHLEGRRHGTTMERYEQELLARFAKGVRSSASLHETTHRDRHRHRHLPGKGGGR
ncbi:MAG: rRNA maturation RNase YbeY [bacterium]